MKKILIGLLVLGSFSTFAGSINISYFHDGEGCGISSSKIAKYRRAIYKYLARNRCTNINVSSDERRSATFEGYNVEIIADCTDYIDKLTFASSSCRFNWNGYHYVEFLRYSVNRRSSYAKIYIKD